MKDQVEILCDMHTHSQSSHDSKARVLDVATSCIERGVCAFAVTDHCDIGYCDSINIASILDTSLNETLEVARKFSDKVEVLAGVEIGEAIWNPSYATELLKGYSYDVVIGSVHAVRYKSYTQPYSTIDFTKMATEELEQYIDKYFDDLLEIVQSADCDVVAHLTCPLRYINGKYGLGVELSKNREKILKILDCIIEKSLSLELNTSGLGTIHNTLMPERWILEEYKKRGGYLITIGSDAHTPEKVANGFEEAIKILKECGFDAYYYYS
jgi:histidinol-phosphatase (PHP family)